MPQQVESSRPEPAADHAHCWRSCQLLCSCRIEREMSRKLFLEEKGLDYATNSSKMCREPQQMSDLIFKGTGRANPRTPFWNSPSLFSLQCFLVLWEEKNSSCVVEFWTEMTGCRSLSTGCCYITETKQSVTDPKPQDLFFSHLGLLATYKGHYSLDLILKNYLVYCSICNKHLHVYWQTNTKCMWDIQTFQPRDCTR